MNSINTISLRVTATQVQSGVEFRLSDSGELIHLPVEVPERFLVNGPASITLKATIHPKESATYENMVEAIILKAIDDVFRVDKKMMKAKTRKREILIPRQVYIYLIYTYLYPLYTWEFIAKLVNYHHCTAMYSVKTISTLKDYDNSMWGKKIRHCINKVSEKLQDVKQNPHELRAN